MNTTELLSTKDVAKKLKTTEQFVRTQIRNEKLSAMRVGKQWVIPSASLDQYINEGNIIIEPDDYCRLSEEIPKIVALSFFSGAMGLDIGMEQAGIKALLACEFDKASRITIASNNPGIALIGDIWDYTPEEMRSMARIPKDRKIDIIWGGPPCQSFSTAGKRKSFDDSRGNVFLRYIDVIEQLSPTYVVIENVRGLLSAPYLYPIDSAISIKGGAFLHILDRLESCGYKVSFNLYNSANFGAPQIRERVVIIGTLKDTAVSYLTPTHSQNGEFGLPKWKVLSDALKNLHASECHHVDFPEARIKYYKMLKEGQYWKDLPLETQKEALGKSFFLGGGKTGFLRRLSFKKPSPTLVTHPAMPATDLAHPIENRPLSVEEYHCIQEFPSDWKIHGSLLQQYRQIGNAVPIALGRAIGTAILNHMNDVSEICYPGFKYSRYKNTDNVSWRHSVMQDFEKAN